MTPAIFLILLLIGLIFLVLSIRGTVPIWVSVLFLYVIELIRVAPAIGHF